jgi:hypothetical protein
MADRTRGKKPIRNAKAARPRGEPEPILALNKGDPDDATARNFRYQHAYGVILLIAARRGDRPYDAIWCEHHEDLLAQRSDGKFDGYQIKTRRPESGPWRLTDAELVHTIARFVDLVSQYNENIAELYFVSNAEFDEVTDTNTDDTRRGRCPRLFLKHVSSGLHPENSSEMR